MRRVKSGEEEDDLRARIARDLDNDEPNTELAPPSRSATVEALLAQGGDLLTQAVSLARAGQREDALQVVSQLLEKEQDRADGWLLLAALSDNAIVAQSCLEQALSLKPGYEAAQAGLDWMRKNAGQVPAHLVEALALPAPAAPVEEAPPVEVKPAPAEAAPAVPEVPAAALEEAPPVELKPAPAEAVPAVPEVPAAALEEAPPVEVKPAPAEAPAAAVEVQPPPVEVAPPAAVVPLPAPVEEAPPPVEKPAPHRKKEAAPKVVEPAPQMPPVVEEATEVEAADPIAEATRLAQAGDHEEALQVLSKALEADPSLAKAWVLMGALTDNAMIARASLEQALQLDPDNAEALDGLRWMGRHPGQVPAFILGEARPSKIIPIREQPPKEIVTAAKSIARKLEGELAAPEEDELRARIARDLEREEPSTELAAPPPSAEVEALMAEGKDPIEQATRLAREGRREDALQVLSKALEADPSLAPAWVLMGALADNAVVARACLEQAILLDSGNPEALDGLRWMSQHPDEVPTFILGEARPKAPAAPTKPLFLSAQQEADQLVGWAVAAIQEQKPKDARAYLERAVELNPQSESAWLCMAAVVKSQTEMRECLERVLEISPDNPEALEGMQWLEGQFVEIPAEAVAPAPPEVVVPPVSLVEGIHEVPLPPVEEVPVAPPVVAPPEKPPVAVPRPLIVPITPAGLPKAQPAGPPEPGPVPAASAGPAVRHVASSRLQQLQQAYRAVEPLPRRRGCRALLLVALALVVVFATLGGIAVGLANAASLPSAPWVLAPPTATPTREERLTGLWQQSETALAQGDWPTAVKLLREVQALDPDRAGLAERRYRAHLSYGLALVDDDHLEAAIAQFDEALAIRPGDPEATRQRRLASLYWEGKQCLDASDWGTAAAKFAELYALDPQYHEVQSLLYTARCRFGNEMVSQGKLEAAIEQYRLALQVIPDGADATAGLKRAEALLPTPTPRPTPAPTPVPRQRIEISVSRQHFSAYQDGTLVFDLVCSTGEPARPTRFGTFKVLDKIPMAYSSVWSLKMPWWLGIYWSGGIENGIHALPILSSGRILWAGFLGQPVSFGCIILDTENAKKVYDWVQIGTPVIITP